MVVDSYVPSSVKLFQVVAGRRLHKVYRRRCIELGKLTLSNALDVYEPTALACCELGFCVLASKGLD